MSRELPDTARIRESLPYGESFLLVDEVIKLEAGRRIVTVKYYDTSNPIIAAHFQSGPHIVPGALLAEQAAQSAQLLYALNSSGDIRSGPLLLGRLKAHYLAIAECPCCITAEVILAVTRSDAIGFFARVRCDDILVANIKGAAGTGASVVP